MEFRSRGGSDEPENIIAICARHHRQIHEGDLKGPYRHDCYRVYTEDVGGSESVDKAKWFLWPEIRHRWEGMALEAHEAVEAGRADARAAFWQIAYGLELLDRHNLWSIFDCEGLDEYLRYVGLRAKPSTAKRWIKAERRRLMLEGDLPERVREQVDQTFMLHAGAALESLPPEQQAEAVEIAATYPSREAVETVREMSGRKRLRDDEEDEQPEWVVDVTARTQFQLKVHASDEQEARDLVRQRIPGITRSVFVGWKELRMAASRVSE